MEIRKCECGGLPDYRFLGYQKRFFVVCISCRKQTNDLFRSKDQAIQAWNEGKVE